MGAREDLQHHLDREYARDVNGPTCGPVDWGSELAAVNRLLKTGSMKTVEVKERVPAGDPTHVTVHPVHLRAWDDWTDEDREHELAMARELSETGSMDEALKMLGSFAKFVQREAPHLSAELAQLAVRWAEQRKVPLDKLMAAMQESE